MSIVLVYAYINCFNTVFIYKLFYFKMPLLINLSAIMPEKTLSIMLIKFHYWFYPIIKILWKL